MYGLDMFPQTGGFPGLVGAVGALERPLPGVDAVVPAEERLVVELFGADGAPVAHEGGRGVRDAGDARQVVERHYGGKWRTGGWRLGPLEGWVGCFKGRWW